VIGQSGSAKGEEAEWEAMEDAFFSEMNEQRATEEREERDWENEGGFIIPLTESTEQSSDEIPF
jgi:hypothetical protein